MRSLITCVGTMVLTSAFAVPALAKERVIMKDGSVRKGEVLEVTETGMKVKIKTKHGSTTVVYRAGLLDTHYFYDKRDDTLGDDARGRLKLALWSLEQGMFSRAKVQVERATEIDPQLVKDIRAGHLPEIREGIARRVLDSAQADIDGGDTQQAERKLEILLARMPDTEAGTEAAQVYRDLQDMVRGREARKQEEAHEKLEAEQQEIADDRRRLLAPVDRLLRRGKELMTDGLTEDSESKALRLLKDAIGKGKAALTRMDTIAKQHAQDTELMAEIDGRRQRTIAAMVKVYLRRADIYIWRGSIPNAKKEIDAARQLDPDNPDITATEARAEQREEQDALELRWTRNRRQGMRFARGNVARGGGARGGRGGGRGGGGGRR